MMGASGKGRARRGAQAERAVPDLAEADLTTRSADRLARRQHVKGEAGGLLQARGEESPEVRNVYDIARRGGDQGNGGSARGAAGEGDGAAGGGDRLGEERGGAGADERLALHARREGDGIVPSAGKGEDEADKPARKREAGLQWQPAELRRRPIQRCGGYRNPSGARYERGEGQAGGSGCGVVRPRRVVMHGGGLRLGRRLGQAVKGGTGESLGSRNQTVHGEQAVERGKGESLGSWEQKVRERKGRARRGARARRAAPDL